ncbi:BREX-1 system adenine-specific DNA-methyltransferase PglX [Pseudoalteromonas sp. TB64]|uniref:BREX-1 system adenine-specific DNA-methyltransferase PglX n=1 Tax=Pseudoalteromonas sp. TB64 TaxID=1938600 RepID=UPI000403F010|nr:BREX-1 system adenine-specific DNA-methyltransferase PglX [Pseudoalteromonas sp. TB64]
MDTSKLKKFAQFARRSLIEQVQNKLKLVLADESAARREHPKAVKDLEQKLNQFSNKKEGEEQLIEQVAYTWFNRFCALRFMDVNQYNRIMVLSPISGQFQPEILAEAKAGHLDDAVFNDKTREQIQGLLSGSVPSRDGQAEAYRLMIVAVCNDYYRLMPFLFQRIEDYTELLMPDDLLSGNSILAYTREAMTPENCESVESIGWLYQFYISEKKDLVFEGLRKSKKITPENIPAATQLFTPHWIVKYLVENSLGRLWMLNNPNSKVIEQMEYYIKPVEEETDFLHVANPEELKVCDSACGSGHMLTYAYDLLYAIYLDANYDPVDIPELILTKNLYGIEIDERASELAAFALSMKALKGNPNDDSNNRRRFFRNPIKPNICRLEKVKVDDDSLEEYMDFIGRDLFTQDLRKTLTEFEEADNFGSLIQPTLTNVDDTLAIIEAKNEHVDMLLVDTHKTVLKILKQTEYLSPRYHISIANPPYLGGKGMNPRMAKWLKDNYPDVKSDLFSAFIVRNTEMTLPKGQLGFMTPFVWMFISSFEKLRNYIIEKCGITSLIQLQYSGFDGATVPICTFTLQKSSYKPKSTFIRLSDFKGAANQMPKALEAIKNPNCGWMYKKHNSDFKSIKGSPIAYWLNADIYDVFNRSESIGEKASVRKGLVTLNDAKFIKNWSEVSFDRIQFNTTTRQESIDSDRTWFPINKGGGYRKWYGFNDSVINWENDGKELKNYIIEKYNGGSYTKEIRSEDFYFKENITWGSITSGPASFRYTPCGFLFSSGGSCMFPNENIKQVLLQMNSSFASNILQALTPTLNYVAGDIARIPVFAKCVDDISPDEIATNLIDIAKWDWDSYESSWDFKRNPLFTITSNKNLIEDRYISFVETCQEKIKLMKQLEGLNNKATINSHSLEKISSEINMRDITLTCNPYYRYGADKTCEEHKLLFKNDLVREFAQYAVGCLFGRFSLDKEGIVLANQGDTLQSYLNKVPLPSLMPDEDNVIPIIDFDGDWFEDDITERFKSFLKVAFGEEHFAENLAFIEEAIGKDIKKYFVKDFYADHVKRYKKRPIYWLFSSPKGSFNALIYMHRYHSDTASIVLNDYLREFRTKLEARKESYEQVEISVSASQKDITQAIKAIAKIDKVLEEVNDYEREVLYPLAGNNIEIDLDDGVKHNYPLFGKALKKVAGLS